MHYSFRNTLCGLAVVIAAGLLADQVAAQTVTLEEDANDVVALSPVDNTSSMPEEISLFDEQMGDVSLPDDGMTTSAQQTNSVATDLIPMEGSGEENDVPTIAETFAATSEEAPAATPSEEQPQENISLSIEGETPQPAAAPLKTVSETPPTTTPQVTGKLLAAKPTSNFDESISPAISNELFQRMSDLEKQTTLLNLELKKERVQNEIAAVRAQRQRAQEEEAARKAEEERKQREWENEQERLMVAEQTKLREAEAALEMLRQEKIVKAYKATMLDSIQKWIKVNAGVYAQLSEKEKEIKQILEDNKSKMKVLQQKADDLKSKAENAKVAYDKKVANLESQISILKTRLEAEIESSKKKIAEAKAESAKGRRNPFATAASTSMATPLAPEKVLLSSEYAIMEISGQGAELAAKLINTEGDVFMVKVGTTLRNGFTIDDISQTYVSAVKDGEKDFLYFSAGGILDHEPIPSDITIKGTPDAKASGGTGNEGSAPSRGRRVNTTQGIPSLGQGMFIR